MRKIISLDGEITAEDLIQRIAESEKSEPAHIHSDEENELFIKRHRLCALLNDIDFTIENYGLVNFFTEYSDQIPDLIELSKLLEEFNEEEVVKAINSSLTFYNSNKARFQYLESAPDDYDNVYEQLENELKKLNETDNFHLLLNQSIANLASYIQSNHQEFFSLSS